MLCRPCSTSGCHAGYGLRDQPDHAWARGSYGFLEKKRDCSAKSDEKIICSANCKNQKFVHKTGRKMGLYRGKNLLVPSPERIKKGLFAFRSEKKVCTGKKNLRPPTRVSYLVRPLKPGKFTQPTPFGRVFAICFYHTVYHQIFSWKILVDL